MDTELSNRLTYLRGTYHSVTTSLVRRESVESGGPAQEGGVQDLVVLYVLQCSTQRELIVPDEDARDAFYRVPGRRHRAFEIRVWSPLKIQKCILELAVRPIEARVA